jgi:hypothetical protein
MSDDTSQAIYNRALADRADTWVPACGGDEIPFEFFGVRWLYVFNPATRKHAYLNLETDMVYTHYNSREIV